MANTGMANVDSKLMKALEASTCFGIAHDDTVPECKQCDVKAQCKARCEGANIPTPTTKPAKADKPVEKATTTKTTTGKAPANPKPTGKKSEDKPPKENKPATTPTPKAPNASGDAPDFKPMSTEQLEKLATERKLVKGVDYKHYDNANIYRMRLIMALKKTY